MEKKTTKQRFTLVMSPYQLECVLKCIITGLENEENKDEEDVDDDFITEVRNIKRRLYKQITK